MVYSEEIDYLQKQRKEVMDSIVSIMNETVEAADESRRIETMIHEMRVKVTTGNASAQDISDYAALVPVLRYKAIVMEKESKQRDEKFFNALKQIAYIDELCKGEY